MLNIVLAEAVFILAALLACTPSATSNAQKANQDSALSATQSNPQSAAASHAEDTQSVPINILCVQVFNDTRSGTSSPCFQREGAKLPGDNNFEGMK